MRTRYAKATVVENFVIWVCISGLNLNLSLEPSSGGQAWFVLRSVQGDCFERSALICGRPFSIKGFAPLALASLQSKTLEPDSSRILILNLNPPIANTCELNLSLEIDLELEIWVCYLSLLFEFVIWICICIWVFHFIFPSNIFLKLAYWTPQPEITKSTNQ